MERGTVPAGPVFLDSPLAIHATEVFRQHASSLDSEVDLARTLRSLHLRFSETVDESKAIEKLSGFHIIVAASGMCDAGRIRHHLKNWLWRRNATILLVGFQAQGTLGRFLSDGAKAVRIQGEEIHVAARIRSMDDYSGHADGPELERWIAARRPIRKGVFLVHGEDDALKGLEQRLANRIIPESRIHIPILDEIYELTTPVPTLVEPTRRRRLTPDAVVHLDWHNDMSKLILDINEKMDSAADDRARGVIIRRLRRALEDQA
jgi:metallo-beta-lactamase family protein